MKTLCIFIAFLILSASLGAATWTGASSIYWNHTGNWDTGLVPTSSTDVIIPNVSNKPVVSGVSANCRNLTINTSATLRINNQPLTVSGDFQSSGLLDMQTTSAVLQVNGDAFWNSGSTLITSGFCNFYYYGDLTLESGSSMVMTAGFLRFRGTLSAYILNRSAATQIWHFHNEKTYTSTDAYSGRLNISNATNSQPFTIMGNLENGATAKLFNDWTGDIILKGNLTTLGDSPYTLDSYDNGSLVMDGVHQSINFYQNAYNPLHNLVCSQTGTLTLNSDLDLNGNMTIESGVLSAGNRTIKLQGNWLNTVGPDAFSEGTSTVSFIHNTDHQYCNSTENFYKLVVSKLYGGALRVNNINAVVTCAQYDWTAGAIDVLAGTFTALDLVDNGLVGKYYVNPDGTINLTNNDGLVDLDGLVNFNGGGTINVYGGTAWSTWKNVDLNMNGGTFAFHDQGVYINGSSSYTFSANLSAGIIQVGGNFQCNRPIAPGPNQMFRFTGTGNYYINMISGTLSNVTIDHEGIGRSYLTTGLTATGDIIVVGAELSIGDETLNCTGYFTMYDGATLLMNNAAGTLNVGEMVWMSGSVANVSLGTIICSGSWRMYAGSTVAIPSTVNINLTSLSTSVSIYNDNPSNFLGNVTIGSASTGAAYTIDESNADLRIAGNLTITAGNELDLGTGFHDLVVDGALYLHGVLDIHATTATVHGKPYLYAGSTLNIDSGTFSCDESTVLPRTTDLNGTLSINTGNFNLVNHNIIVNAGSVNTMASGTIVCTGISAETAGTFQPAGGTVSMVSNLASARSRIKVNNGNWLPNLTIEVEVGMYLADNLTIKGNLTILEGFLEARFYSSTDTYNITISGNWNNQGGTFYPDTGKVTFNGSGHQYLQYSETFNILEANKSSGAIRVDGSGITVACAQYDWTAGAVDVLEGTLTINDLADNGMYGGFYCTPGGILNITQDSAQGINLFGTLQVTGGTINIYGGNADASWARYSASTVNVTGGSLIYHNRGIQIRNTYVLTYNISAGTISTAGQIYCNRTDFIPAGGTFEMTGATDTLLDFQSAPGSSLFNLKINKAGLSNRVSQAASTQTIRGTLTIDNGTYYMTNRTLNCLGNLIVNYDGKLFCQNANTVKIASGRAIIVNDGGYIEVLGTNADTRTTFTRYNDGTYNFYAYGGHVGANFAVFEYMGPYGIYISAYGVVDGLHNCTFQNGTAGAPLLWIGNEQNLTMTYASFPTNAGGGAINIFKPLELGSITLSNYSGAFSGAAFEEDPFGRIFWTGTANDLLVTAAILNRPDDYVCAPLTFSVTVTNSGSNDIATPFRVDLYKNLASAPAAGTLGDHFLEIPSLDAGQSKTVTFTNVSTDVASTWTSWLRLDTTGFVTETNEANNVSGPYVSVWQALPDIADLIIEQTGPAAIRLTWVYPISVSRYNVYRSTDPFFTPAPGNLWAWPTSPLVNTGGYEPMYYYIVRAERDLPTP